MLALSLACCLALVACGGGGSDGGETQSAPVADLPRGCRSVPAPAPRKEGEAERPSPERLEGAASVELQTNCGTIVIRLATGRAPRTTASFAALARNGFYDGLSFHRVSGDPTSGPFVIQGGDPLGSGQGGPGYSVRERPPSDLTYVRGVVAMAKSEAEASGTSGSQFFIVTAPDAGLPPDYALVGSVSDGLEVVDAIATVKTDGAEKPLAPIVIQRAIVQEG